MTTKKAVNVKMSSRSILSYIKDLPNICSLAGLGCTLIAIYFLILDIYDAAMIGMIWAVAFDWADGLIARKMKGRTGVDLGGRRNIKKKRDSVSYGVTPAILILSYFSTFGLSSDKKYTGLAIDNNSIILVFLFMFSGHFERHNFSIFLAACGVCLAILNVSQIKTPKLSGNTFNVVLLAIYTLIATVFYGWSLF